MCESSEVHLIGRTEGRPEQPEQRERGSKYVERPCVPVQGLDALLKGDVTRNIFLFLKDYSACFVKEVIIYIFENDHLIVRNKHFP